MKPGLKSAPRVHEEREDRVDACDVDFFDVKKIKWLRKRMRPEQELYELAEVFGILSDTTRLKIVLALTEAELCVCDLANFLGITKSAVSHHLRLLRALRLVKFRREGKMTYYALDDAHITTLLRQATEHVQEDR
jgi:ArsR family transcriptional regulator